ncbi:VOC family protein [Fulvivirgaceae bacterium BMA10]|uniref:VOC family protein n=1 Tax=Splendidivirga corallicola TaxID=3051826 RepID=A0ABT8KL75_9BACT|nr:VOC family protein [Fulvivirgaceae bacterium BMA10]
MNLNQITIPSLNLYKAIEFYQKLGLKLIVDAAPRYVRFLCPEGNSTFSIHKVEELPKGDGVHIYFEDDHLDEKVEQLQSVGIEFIHGPIDQTWLWREARLKDPDGNLIILFHAGENRINPPWRVNPED